MTVTLFLSNVIAYYNLWPRGVGVGPLPPLLLSTLVIATMASRGCVCRSSRETAHSLPAKEPLCDAELWLLEHIPPPPTSPRLASGRTSPCRKREAP